MAIISYKDLEVWQLAVELSVSVYKTTGNFPNYEIFGLTSQVRRAATSIPANIAEGQRRGHREFAHFLKIAFGSGAELETHLLIASRVGYLTSEDYNTLLQQLTIIQRMLNRLLSSLNN